MALVVTRYEKQGIRLRVGLEEIWVYIGSRFGNQIKIVIHAPEGVEISREEQLALPGPFFDARAYESKRNKSRT